jgi:hypothetical protein
MSLGCGRAAISLNFWLAVGLSYSHEKRTVPLRPPEIHTLSSTAFDHENQAQSMPARWLQVQGLQSGQAGAVIFCRGTGSLNCAHGGRRVPEFFSLVHTADDRAGRFLTSLRNRKFPR